jgi:hypothetical protein
MVEKLPACRADAPLNAPWWWQRANWLYRAISSGELPDHDGTVEMARFPVVARVVGQLSFVDGRLVVADPYLMGDEPIAVVQELVSTPYDVVVALAELGPENPRISAAMLVQGADPIVAWEMAQWVDQDPASLSGEEFFGYGVDAGTGPSQALKQPRSPGAFSQPTMAGWRIRYPER